ncbi:hypothetical protein, partial [Streptomyces sp. URMC 123]|uniref:hypothetical protein n=1 Tax=Streptomyces sp. URMC 123 TaxID=3423403 RepID=UPI003F1C4F8F
MTVKEAESDSTRAGARTSTLIVSVRVVASVWNSSVCSTVWVAGAPFANSAVFHPPSDDRPLPVTQRYSTRAGTRPTVTSARKYGAPS